jgi:hypothetical protein
MTLVDLFILTLAAALVVGFLVVRWLLGVAGDMAREARRQLARRAVDALLAVLVYSWWKGKQAPARPRPPVLEGDDLFRACTLSRWTGDPACCRMCDAPIPTRRERFCSSPCDRAYRENHVFGGPGGARETRLRTDGDRCTWDLGGRPCGATHTAERSLEVDHIDQALGRHGEVSCIHHQANLRSLCGPHHDAVTAHQNRTRRHHVNRRRSVR